MDVLHHARHKTSKILFLLVGAAGSAPLVGQPVAARGINEYFRTVRFNPYPEKD
jgi:hypothetical protein